MLIQSEILFAYSIAKKTAELPVGTPGLLYLGLNADVMNSTINVLTFFLFRFYNWDIYL